MCYVFSPQVFPTFNCIKIKASWDEVEEAEAVEELKVPKGRLGVSSKKVLSGPRILYGGCKLLPRQAACGACAGSARRKLRSLRLPPVGIPCARAVSRTGSGSAHSVGSPWRQ